MKKRKEGTDQIIFLSNSHDTICVIFCNIYIEHVRDRLLVAMGRLLDKRGGEIRRKEREIPQGTVYYSLIKP